MRFSLPTLAREAGVKRSRPLPNIEPTNAQRETLRRIYERVVRHWYDGARQRLLPQYRSALSDSYSGYKDEEAALEREAQALIANLTFEGGAISAWAVGIEAWHTNRVISGALSAANVDLSTRLSSFDVRQTVQEALDWNTSLISNVSDDMRNRIESIFFDGFRTSKPAAEIGREITKATGVGRRRAKNIAADQTTKLSAALDRARQDEMGLTEWVWRSSHKVNYRPEHLARDGKHYASSVAEAKATGLGVPPIGDMPGDAINCGCTRQAWLRLEDEDIGEGSAWG